MEKRGSRLEVLGVPDIMPPDRMIDKLFIHFLRPRHGGGEVLWVVYPANDTGQAFVIFEDPEVAARVLQQSSHMLKVDNQQFPLRVKAADTPEVDLPVEFTLHLSKFPDEAEVRRLLRSHGLETTEQSRGQVRVKGSFTQLRAVRVRLDELLNPKTQTQISQNPASPVPRSHQLSSGAIPKNYTDDSLREDSKRSPPVSSNKSWLRFFQTKSSSKEVTNSYDHPASPEFGASQFRQNHSPSTKSGFESFVIDADVLDYAHRFRNRDISSILKSYNTKLEQSEADKGLSTVFLSGKRANSAAKKLQSLLNDLGKTLRTQEINLADLDHDSRVDVGRRIQKYKDIFNMVFIRQVDDTVYLVGPSADSYELKQRLLGRPVDRTVSVQRGRAFDRGSKERRSSSLPKISHKQKAERSYDAINAFPANAQGYSPSRYQDDEGEDEIRRQLKYSGSLRGRRSHSESREVSFAEKPDAHRPEKENKQPHHGPTKMLQSFMQNLNKKDIKNKLKINKNK